MNPEVGSMLSWTERPSTDSRALSKALSPSKWGSFADRVYKTRILYKGRSCSCNFGGKLFLRYYRLYLEETLVLKVTAKVTATSSGLGQKGGENCGDAKR
jgi:hypothetical protein